MVEVLLLGLLAGGLTTLAGMGGGMAMVIGLAMTRPVGEALLITTPALLLGNLHRLALYRQDLHREDATRYAVGGVVGAFAGAQLAVSAPDALLRAGVAVLALLAAIRLASDRPWTLPGASVMPGGVAVGVLSATVGAGGILAGPMLLGRGHVGTTYVVTAAAGATAVHVGRIAGYTQAGWGLDTVWLPAALATVVLTAGNLAAHRVRPHLSDDALRKTELGAVLLCAGMVLAGSLNAWLLA
jgi:uncharacterized membrane protein YfcA